MSASKLCRLQPVEGLEPASHDSTASTGECLSSQTFAGAYSPNVDIFALLHRSTHRSRIRTSGAARTTARPSRRNLSRGTSGWSIISFSAVLDCNTSCQGEQGDEQTCKEYFGARVGNTMQEYFHLFSPFDVSGLPLPEEGRKNSSGPSQ
jgi:hypothetical protein